MPVRSVQRLTLAIALVVAAVASAAAQPLAPIHYTLRFPAPQTNYVEVEALVPAEGQASVELMIAVWTPGSYLVREYERNVERVAAAANGRSLAVDKTAKNRWKIAAAGAREITVKYRVYAHEMGVRSNWVDADFAMLNGAPTFLTLVPPTGGNVGTAPRPHDVRVELPPGWKTSVSALPDARAGEPNHYLARDYDTLVDSPLVAGNPAIHTFTVAGKSHLLVDIGEDNLFDGAHAAGDLAKIVEAQRTFWRSLPYDRYVFFNVLSGGGGGAIEHKNSVMMMATRWDTRVRERYSRWLSTASHEFFHLWNVKRLRPIELGPFDYERENYPRTLWVSEGFTDYYADVLLARAGLLSADGYLAQLSSTIKSLQTTPGRLVQSAEMASFDAWVKEYRPDENSVNTSISYYTKGSIVAFLLDARIRGATNGTRSLDDVMRLAFERYSGQKGFTPQQFQQTASEVAGIDLSSWFQHAVQTTDEVDYRQALDWFGLEFRVRVPSGAPMAWLGARTKSDNGRLVVTSVPRGTPAYDAGLNPDDEIIAIDDLRVRPEQLDDRLRVYRGGDKVTLLVARREELKRLTITLGPPQTDPWFLGQRQDATPAQRARLSAWVGSGEQAVAIRQ